MAFQTDRIQLLIAEIDDVLEKNRKSRLGWLNFGNSTQERQVLEKVRTNLQKLQQQLASTTSVTPTAEEIAPLQTLPLKPEDSFLSDRDRPKTPDRILEAVVQEMGYLRTFYERATYTHLRQQYQADLEILHQQRQTLLEEIAHLQERKKNYTSLPEAGASQKELEAGSISEETNNLLSKAPIDPAKTELEQEQVISSQTQNPIVIPETLPYAGTELIGAPIELNEGSILQTEDERAEPIDLLEADAWEISELSQKNLPADESEEAPSILSENSRTDVNPTSSDTISALTDLIASPSLEKTDNLENTPTIASITANLSSSEANSEIAATPNADDSAATENFLPASPDEDLLPTLESSTKSNVDLWLGKNMLDQLSEDLSSLEGVGGTEVQEQADIIDARENRNPASVPANETQLNIEPSPITEHSQDLSSDRQAQHRSTETETVDPLEPVPAVPKEEIAYNIPEDILAEFDDLFGESFEKMGGFEVADGGESLPLKTDRYPEQEKKN